MLEKMNAACSGEWRCLHPSGRFACRRTHSPRGRKEKMLSRAVRKVDAEQATDRAVMSAFLYAYLLCAYLTQMWIVGTVLLSRTRALEEDWEGYPIEIITIATLVVGWPFYWWSISKEMGEQV